MYTPICIFAFNRPEHLRRTLEALAANELAAESDLVIICDGARNDSEQKLTTAVRALARATGGFRSCTVIERERNYGLASNIIAGVTELLEVHESLIVLEDDLITSPYFLRYMNDGLTLYAKNPKVASIHGYCFPHVCEPESATFFLKGADCLGWGTWRRAWSIFEPDAEALLAAIRKKGESFAFNRNLNYDYTGMLQLAASGKVSSWAVRWLAATWLNDMYTLYPSESLIYHAGSDGSGTNCGTDTLHDVPLAKFPISVYAIRVQEDKIMARDLCSFLRAITGGPLFIRLQRLKQFVHRKFPSIYFFLRSLKRRMFFFSHNQR